MPGVETKDIAVVISVIAAIAGAYAIGYGHAKVNAEVKIVKETVFVKEQQVDNTQQWHDERDNVINVIEKGKSKNEECAFVLNYPVVDCLRADTTAGELLPGVQGI